MKKPSYLYGTIHIQDKRVFDFDQTVTDAFNSSEAFAMEILMDKIDPEEMKNAMLMKNTTLDQLLSEEQYKVTDSIVKSLMGVGLIMFNKMKPFFLSSSIDQMNIAKDMELPLDLYFLERARKDGKACYGVEKFSDQINAVDAISYQEQAEMLYMTLTDTAGDDALKYQIEDLIDAYLSFDLNKIMEMTNDESEYSDKELAEKFKKLFIIDRNKVMAKNLQKIMKKQSCFCAVGAAHLPEEYGVIELLRKAGYTVEPVIFSWINN